MVRCSPVWPAAALPTRNGAVDVAARAFEDWAVEPVPERVRALRRIARRLEEEAAGPLARIATRETGKRLEEAQAEISLSARYFDWFADVISTLHSEVWEAVPGLRHLVRWRSLGVAAVITPWNFPVSIPPRKVAPALAAGCTVVFRPSQYTPQSLFAFAEILEELLPAGVVNTVVGDAATVSGTWIRDRRVRGLSFTGSTEVGRKLAATTGENLMRATFELGGRAPFVVCPTPTRWPPPST